MLLILAILIIALIIVVTRIRRNTQQIMRLTEEIDKETDANKKTVELETKKEKTEYQPLSSSNANYRDLEKVHWMVFVF